MKTLRDYAPFLAVIAVVLGVWAFMFSLKQHEQLLPTGGDVPQLTDLETKACGGTTAANGSTSPAYLSTAATASSTCIFPISNARSVVLNFQFISSTTSSRLQFAVYYSNDGIDWFGEDGATLTSNTQTTHGATAIEHVWTPATTTAARKSVTITPTAAAYMKINYGVTGANGSLWLQAVKNNRP